MVWGRQSFHYTLNPGAAATFTWTGEQAGETGGFPELDRTVDLPFRNRDGSRVMLTYNPALAPYQHMLPGNGGRVFTYTLPAGASIGLAGAETRLPRTGWTASASSSAPEDPPAGALDGDRQPAGVEAMARRTATGSRLTWERGRPSTASRSTPAKVSATSRVDIRCTCRTTVSTGQRDRGRTGSGQQLRIVFPPVTARYVRVVIMVGSGNWWSIAELDVFSTRAGTRRAGSRAGRLEAPQFAVPGGALGVAVYNEQARPVRFRVPQNLREVYNYVLPSRAAAIFTWTGPGLGLPPAPSISSIAPGSGIPGTQVELRGANLGEFQGASAVMFGGLMAPIISWSDTAIVVLVLTSCRQAICRLTWWSTGAPAMPAALRSSARRMRLPRAGWSARASSSQPGDAPGNALDGDLATRWSTGAAQEPGQWFEVDMGAPQRFGEVVLDAGASAGDYPRGYEVYISSDGTSWGTPVATGVGGVVSSPRALRRLPRAISAWSRRRAPATGGRSTSCTCLSSDSRIAEAFGVTVES